MTAYVLGFAENVPASYSGVYTSTVNSAILVSCVAANNDGNSTKDITVALRQSSTVKAYLGYTIPIPADSSVDLVANKVVIPSGYNLAVQSSSASGVSLLLSVVEV
jgi:hypothetical protein